MIYGITFHLNDGTVAGMRIRIKIVSLSISSEASPDLMIHLIYLINLLKI
jgi:hypothetical protein